VESTSGRIKDMQGRGFDEGSMVLLTLNSPRQKFFGALRKLASAGVELRGVPLESLDDLARQIRAGEQANASTLFFPMHRVEQMELDAPAGELPSLSESFATNAGRSVGEIFGEPGIGERWS
jgi:hypothetical protein